MKKLVSLLLTGTLALGLLAGCGSNGGGAAATPTPATGGDPAQAVTLKIGASPAPHEEILQVVKEILAGQGITLEIVEFTDYIQPNEAVESGEIHYEPMGIYAGRVASLTDLPDGAEIGVPNDPTNGGRALLLLQEQGLITLPEDAGLEPTVLDIVDNPHNFKITEMEAAQLPRSLDSLDVAVVNGNYAIQAGLKMSDALAIESAEGTAGTAYVNVLTVKEGRENETAIQALAEAMKSQQVKDYITETYGGAVVAVF